MGNNKKILLIDDETEILSLLSFLLKVEGYDVHTSDNSPEALEMILKNNYDGVVSDLSMPDMNGVELLRKIRSENLITPFVFLSGHARPEDEHDMANLGAYELIMKPHVERVSHSLKKLIKDIKEVKVLEKVGEEAGEFLEMLHETNRKVG